MEYEYKKNISGAGKIALEKHTKKQSLQDSNITTIAQNIDLYEKALTELRSYKEQTDNWEARVLINDFEDDLVVFLDAMKDLTNMAKLRSEKNLLVWTAKDGDPNTQQDIAMLTTLTKEVFKKIQKNMQKFKEKGYTQLVQKLENLEVFYENRRN